MGNKDGFDFKKPADSAWELFEKTGEVSYYLLYKNLMKKYGGSGTTCHCERDGTPFETTPILLKGNNSEFHYNRPL